SSIQYSSHSGNIRCPETPECWRTTMSEVQTKTLGELIRSRQPGHGMPGELFGRQDVFETDVEVFFHKHWILVGVTADVPEPGDVSTVDIGKASIIIVRDDDGNVRTYR